MSSKLVHRMKRLEKRLMGRLDSIGTALDNVATQLAQLTEQIQALEAGQVSQEEIDALAARAQAAADAIDAAIEVPGEDDPAPQPEPAP